MGAAVRLRPSCGELGDDDGAGPMAAERRGGEGRCRVRASRCGAVRRGLSSSRLSVGERAQPDARDTEDKATRENGGDDVASTVDSLALVAV